MRMCRHCGKAKSVSNFHKQQSNKDGLSRMCLDCKSSYARERTTGHSPVYVKNQLAVQQGLCDICNYDDGQGGKTLHADHDHMSGQPRGLLCSRCNIGLGCFKDNPDFLRIAAHYIETYKAKKAPVKEPFQLFADVLATAMELDVKDFVERE